MPRILLAGCLITCCSIASAQQRPLAHMVFFTLQEDSPENRQQLVDACQKHLSGHEGVIHFSAGAIADELQREVNDRQFDVALHLVFQDKQSHDRYQSHPRHLKFIEQNKHLWSQVRVFDSYIAPAALPLPVALGAKLSFSFQQLSLDEALKALEAELGKAQDGPPLRMQLETAALQLQGITRNQQIRAFSVEQEPAEKILTLLLLSANPISGAKANSPNQKLVWVVGPDRDSVLITTREAAENGENGYSLPPVFQTP